MKIFDTGGYLSFLGMSYQYYKESKIYKFYIRIRALNKGLTYATWHNK